MDVRSRKGHTSLRLAISAGEDIAVTRTYLSVISTLSRILWFVHAKLDAFEHPERAIHSHNLQLQIMGVRDISRRI